MKKRLLLLPLFAGMVLSGCDFSLESLKFWEKKSEVVDEGGDNKPDDDSHSGDQGGDQGGGDQGGETAKKFSDAVSELNTAFASHGISEKVSLPEPAAFEYVGVQDQYATYYCVAICGKSSDTEDSYFAKLQSAGYTVETDEQGKFASKGDFEVVPIAEEGYFYICVYNFGDAGGGGGEEEGDGAYFDFEEITDTKGSVNGFSFTTDKGTGQNPPAYNSNSAELRLYVGNTITFKSSVPMTSIEFDANSCVSEHDKANGTLAASVGSISGFTWSGSATEVTFTVDSGKQVHIMAIAINDGEGGGSGGGDVVSNEFPAEAVNAYTEELGSSVHLPEFSGTASSYSFSEEYAQLVIEVGAGNETAGVSQYASDLLAAGFSEGEADKWGDMHYISSDGLLDVCPWDSTTASTPVDGYVYVDIVEYVPVVKTTEFPLETVNAYLNADEAYGFTFAQSIATAINALSNEFSVENGTDSLGYPTLTISIKGDVASEVESIIQSTITSAGFQYYSDYEAYYNSQYYCIAVYAMNGVTYLYIG